MVGEDEVVVVVDAVAAEVDAVVVEEEEVIAEVEVVVVVAGDAVGGADDEGKDAAVTTHECVGPWRRCFGQRVLDVRTSTSSVVMGQGKTLCLVRIFLCLFFMF